MRRLNSKALLTTSRRWGESALSLAKREALLLCILLAVAGGVWAFLLIGSEMLEGETGTIDQALLLALRDQAKDPIGPAWLQQAMVQFTALGSTAVLALITVAAIGWMLLWRKYWTALLATLAIGGGALLSSTLKGEFGRARPELVPHGELVSGLSFPSGHAFSSAVVYLTLAVLLARVQPHRRPKIYLMSLAIFLTLLIGVSRVYLGVHWPSDVLAGWCVGSAWALLWWAVALLWSRRAKV